MARKQAYMYMDWDSYLLKISKYVKKIAIFSQFVEY